MKRLRTVALGIALSTVATAAIAAPNHIPTSENPANFSNGNGEYSRSHGSRRSASRRHRPQAYGRSSRRHSNRAGRRTAVQSGRRNSLAARSFMRYASPGTSRGCLTSAARALLGRIEAQFGRVQVVSTCRPGARVAGTGRISRHASGNAVDFNAPGGRKGAIVRWLIANHRSGGTMTYAGMSHIHVDIGPRFVSLNSGGRWR
jgi:Peptidase M15